jgi:hypothetical protein
MPGFPGTGLLGYGPVTGRGMGLCGGGLGRGRGFGRGQGFGRRQGLGCGPGAGMGWASIGYGGDGSAAMRAALETRRDFLRAELGRAEAMLSEEPAGPRTRGDDKEPS